MLQITLDSKEGNNSNETKKNKKWGFKVKIIKEGEESEMILSFEEELSFPKDENINSSISLENGLERI
ncbi:MAG: hypothetical protein N2321_07800 [Melioribacteraceae bacterium]|nr:hypothetical protein [Melioribacteraceae bacterium]